MLLEPTYDLRYSLNYPNFAEELADWLIEVVAVLDAEPDTHLFPLIARLAYVTIDYTYEADLNRAAAIILADELRSAYILLRTGNDPHEVRAAFVLALVRATKHLS